MTYKCNNYTKKADTVRKSAGTQKKNSVKADRQKRSDVKYPASTTEKTQEAVVIPARKSDKKKPEEPNQYILTFPETCKILLFMSRNYKISISVGISSSPMHPTIYVFDIGAGQSFTRADFLDQSWLDNVCQRDMQ